MCYLASRVALEARKVFPTVDHLAWSPDSVFALGGHRHVLVLGGSVIFSATALREMLGRLEAGADVVLPVPISHYPGGTKGLYTLKRLGTMESEIYAGLQQPIVLPS